MSLYELMPPEGYELCHPLDESEFEEIIVLINGVPRASNWCPIFMTIIHEDEGQDLAKSDSPWLGPHALIFRPNAVAAMAPLLEEYGELLPLSCEEAELVMFNPTKVIDALDEEASSVTRFSSGRLMDVSRFAFRSDIVRYIQIFKIPNFRASPTFVGDQFVKRWKSAGLRGLRFQKVWSA